MPVINIRLLPYLVIIPFHAHIDLTRFLKIKTTTKLYFFMGLKVARGTVKNIILLRRMKALPVFVCGADLFAMYKPLF